MPRIRDTIWTTTIGGDSICDQCGAPIMDGDRITIDNRDGRGYCHDHCCVLARIANRRRDAAITARKGI